MDITPQSDTQQPISDDQELAKALAGVLPDVPEPVVIATAPDPVPAPVQQIETPSMPPLDAVLDAPIASSIVAPSTTVSSSDLDGIKKDALIELRPLIDKVELPAEEKFDTYLMLIRSTDDSTLIAPAHAAAQAITDETRRAEALLDIIKEIDYLSRGNQQNAA